MPTEKQYKVLLIDDSAEDRAMYCRYLQRGSSRAYQILEADSTAVGLDLYHRSLPDVVLLDYSLPDMDGLDVLAVLQQTEKQRTPVLMITGQGHETIAVQAIKSGAQDYLIKGNLTAVGLCRAIDNAIEQFQLQQQLQRQEQQQQIINAIALEIRQSLQLEEILENTVTEVQQFLKADRVMVYKFQPDMNGTIVTESVLPGWSAILDSKIQDTCFQHNRCGNYRTGKSWAIANIYQANLTPCHRQLLEQFEVKANLVAPILVEGELWGLLIAHQCSDFRQWQSSELDLLEALVVQIAIAIQQATAYQQAQDELAKRQRIEATLRKSEQYYATLTEIAPVGIFQTDTEGHCLYANERWCQIAGLTLAEAAGFGWVNGIHPDDRGLVSEEWYASVQENRPFRLEYRFQNAVGQITWALGQATAERGVTGEITGYVGTITDITDRKAAEQALKIQSDFNQLIAEITSRFVDLSPDALDAEIERTLQLISEITQVDTSYLIKFNQATRTLSMTHEWCQSQYLRQIALVQDVPLTVFPCSTALLLNRETHYVPCIADLPAAAAIDQASFQRFNLTAVLSVPLIQKSVVSGFMGFASFSQTMNCDEETIRLLRIMGQTIANAQERAQDEQQLSMSEERLRLALAATKQGLYDLNLQTGAAIVTPEYATMLGYDPATFEETNAKWAERMHPDDRESVAAIYQAYVAGNLPEYKVEFRQRTQSDEWKWILSLGKIVEWDSTGQPLRMLGTHTDISDRKQAEAERLQAEQTRNELKLLESILNIILAGYWDWDIPNNQEYLSPGFKRMFGYEEDELPNVPESWQRLIFADDLPGVLDCFDRHVQSHGAVPFYNEVRYRHKDGSTVWVICSGQVIEWDSAGKPLRMIGCHIDISDRKQAEQTLNQYAHEVEDLYNNAPCGYHSLDGEGRIITINDTELQWLGYTRPEILGKSFADITTEASFLTFQKNYSEFKRRGWVQDLEFDLVCKDGSIFPIFLSATAVKDPEENYLYSRSTLYDARDRKQFEASLMRYERIISSTKDGIALLDRHYTYQVANQAYLTWCNKSQDEVIGHSVRDVLGSELFDDFIQPRLDQCLAGQTVQYEKWFDSPNVVPQFLSVTYTPYLDVNQTVAGMIVSLRDITDRRQAEEQLRKSDAHLKTAQRIAQLGSWELDLRTGQITWSEEVFRIFGRDPALDTPSFEELQQLIHLDDRDAHQQVVQTAIETAQPYEIEFRFYRPDGTLKYTYARGEPIVDIEGQLIQLVGTVLDITDRKQVEQELTRNRDLREAIFNESADALFLVAPDTFVILDCNQRAVDLFGVGNKAELIGIQGNTLHRHQFSDQELADIVSEMQAKGFWGREIEYVTRQGNFFWGSIAAKPIAVAERTMNLVRVTDITDRKQAEEALRESEEFNKRILESSSDCIKLIDLEGRLQYMNAGGQCIMEIDDFSCCLNAEWVSSWPEVARPDLEAAITIAKTGQMGKFQGFCPTAKGTPKWWDVVVTPMQDEAGQVTQFLAVSRDISGFKQAEVLLLKSDTHLKMAQRIGKLGSWEFDLRTGQITWSDEVFRIFGRDPAAEPPSFEELQQLFHPDDGNQWQQVVQTAIDTVQAYEHEYRLYCPDGTLRYIQARGEPIVNATGQLIQLVGTALDITDRKQAEEELRSLSDRLSLALKSGAIAIWDWNVPENILIWDDRMYELYGITPNQFTSVYDAWANSLHPDDRPLAETAIQQALAGEKDYDPEFRVVHPDGTIHFLKAAALVQRNSQGEPQYMVGINFDITERKQAEIELMKTTAQLEASNKELEAFAYSVSHDLRSPLRAIDGFSRALLEDYGDQFGEEGKDYFDRIRHNVGRMGTLIDDLLNLSRVSRSEMQYNAVNLSILVQEQLHELQALEPERQVIVVVAPEAIVSADATLMRVVISNLLQNAWKFTGHHATARLEFGVMQREGESIYFVRDDGAGFDMAYAKMLFGVFQRLHNTHEFPGTGIGLATVQRAIHRHGGRVWAEGAVEQGATLYFTVPHSHLQTGA